MARRPLGSRIPPLCVTTPDSVVSATSYCMKEPTHVQRHFLCTTSPSSLDEVIRDIATVEQSIGDDANRGIDKEENRTSNKAAVLQLMNDAPDSPKLALLQQLREEKLLLLKKTGEPQVISLRSRITNVIGNDGTLICWHVGSFASVIVCLSNRGVLR